MLELHANTRLGSYELVRLLGSGGMGFVYEARHAALDRRVALKILRSPGPDASSAPVALERFAREGRAAAQVRHPHVVGVFDFGVENGTPFLVMELVEGETLADRIRRQGTLAVAEAVELLLPIVSGVAELHAAGIIHRDLKPANILLGRGRGGETCPKVADFGVSRADDDSAGLTASGVVLGTYAYMAPEQARASKAPTARLDQYALGAILYQCVAGVTPFTGESPYDLMNSILHAPLVAPSLRKEGLPEALDAVLLRALARDPDARFPCVEDFGAALLPFASPATAGRWARELTVAAEPSDAPIPAVTSPLGAATSTRRGRSSAVLSFLGGLAFAGVLALSTRSNAPPTESQPIAVGNVLIAPAITSPPLTPLPSSDPPVVPVASVAAHARPPGSRRQSPRPSNQHAPTDGVLDNQAPVIDPR